MISLQELAAALGLALTAAGEGVLILRVSSIGSAEAGSLVFAVDEASSGAAFESHASAVIVEKRLFQTYTPIKPVLLSTNPRLDFARAARLLRSGVTSGAVHASAIIEGGAVLCEGVSVGAYAVIGAKATVGSATRIGEGVVIGEGVAIGRECRIYPRVVIYPGTVIGDRVVVHAGAVLGGDGFGYVRDPENGDYLQFPQQGRLIVEDDVEIGANTTIDRGALDETRIGRGTKIDNLVHLGHNVQVGRNTVIAAQTGVSGSSTIGSNVMLGGQVGMGDHAHIGDGVVLGGQGGVLPGKTLSGPGVVFWGTPAQPVKDVLREMGILRRLRRSPKGEKG